MLATATTWGIDFMAEINDKVQSSHVDARKIWLPLGTVALAAAALIGVGMWIQQKNNDTTTVSTVAEELKTLNTQLATMQGSINALMGMQAELAKTSANVGSLKSQMESFDTRLQTMDAWIQTTRGRLQEQGFRNLPEYQPHSRGSGGS